MSGHDTELGQIDPVVRIYTRIELGGGPATHPCPRELTISVPRSYVNSGTVFNLGTLNLAQMPGNTRKCI
ncbi:hypothetical protein ABT354_23305 [Streptomyces sp. NPDC000594]|uniref:hypothetical protein n=1 Tax=Streptomyces sp. NPDC000594 TaxID=3154261 RepID=UPI003332A340